MDRMKNYWIAIFAAIVLLVLLAGQMSAQQITATVTGSITDPAGAVVPGATVTVTSVDTGIVKTAIADDSGNYTVTFLPPGTYNFTVDKEGFAQTARNGIKLEVAQTASIDFALGVTAQDVSVDVSLEETPLLQTETSQLETTVEQRLVEDLPSENRNIFSFVNLVPGTIDSGAALGNPGSSIGSVNNRNFFDSNFAVNGGRSSTNDVLLDGVTNTIGDFNGVTISPPQDAIREFKVVSGVAPAEYGRTGGGIVTIASKAGTRKFHGSLYEYYQDGNFDANGFFNNRRGVRRVTEKVRHQFGGAIGGPLYFLGFGNSPDFVKPIKDTFFFANYELRREKNPFSRITTMPTERMRRGDFGELLGAARAGQTNPDGSPALFGQIYNPYGPLVGGKRQPFANNDLSGLPVCAPGPRTAACLDPVALAVMQYLPLPNRDGLVNNYVFSDTIDFTRDIVAARIDHTVSERQNFFVRFSYENRQLTPPNFLGSVAAATSAVNDQFLNTTFNHVYSLTSTVINNFRYGYTRAAAKQGPESFGFDPTSLGLPAYVRENSSVLVFPTFTIGGGSVDNLIAPGEIAANQIGGTGNDQSRDTHMLGDSVTWISGNHTIRFGGEYRLYRFYPFQFLTPTGSYSFTRIATRGPIPSNSPSQIEAAGSSLASFLLGIPSGVTQEVTTPITIYHHYVAGFVQDDWKIFRNLTLNLGLRWDFETGTASPQQLVTNFDFEGTSPLQGRLNLATLDPHVATLNPGIRNLTGLLSFPEGPQTKTNFDRFAPRLGFAYSLNQKTTLRGGFGMFFLPISLEGVTALGTNFTNSQNQTSFNTGSNPQVVPSTVFLSDPFPGGMRTATGNTLGANTALGLSLGAVVEPERANPYNMQWNLVLQRELARNLVLDIAYVGGRGRNLPTRDINLNQISPEVIEYARGEVAAGRATSVATFLSQSVPNPFAGLLPGTPLNGATINRAQLLRRFPQYQTVTYSRPHIGRSDYHAMQVNLQKRFSDGFSVLANYTWSKLLDTGGVGNGAAFTDPTNSDDIFAYDEEYSYSTLDVPHRFTLSSTYELPFGKDKMFGTNWSGLTNALLGGWQISGTAVIQTGAPLTITTANAFPGGGSALTTIGVGQRRPNRVPGVDPMPGDFGENVRNGVSVFDPAAFSQPSDANFEFGNAARTYNDIRRDNYKNLDVSIIKNVYFSDGKQKLQLRAEFLNVFNLVVFGTPVTSFGSATFGQVTTQGNRPRIIQLVGRFTF